MQIFVKIVLMFQVIGQFHFFQNLDFGKASSNDKFNFQTLQLGLVNINVYAKFYPNIPYGSRVMGHFHFFTIRSSAKPRPVENNILQSPGLDLVDINVYAKIH